MSQDYMTTGTGSSGAAGGTTGSTGSTSSTGAAGGTSTNGSRFGQSGVGGSGMSSQMQDAMNQAQERFSQARDFVQQNATQHPIMTTAVALGAGLLLGMMMSGGAASRR